MMFDDFETGRRRNEIQKGWLWALKDSRPFSVAFGGPCLLQRARLAVVGVGGRHVGLRGGWMDALEMLKFKQCERIKTRDSRHCWK